MITLTAELNGVKKEIKMPSNWNDPTFKQYLGMFDLDGKDESVLALFTGLDKDLIRRAKITGLETVLTSLDFIKDAPEWTKTPELFCGHLMPKDITFEALAPYADCRDLIEKSTDDLKTFASNYAKICAIYLYCVRNGYENYDYDKAMELEEEVLNQPAWEVAGLGSFFITKFSPLKISTKKNCQTEDSLLKRLKQGTKNLVKRLGFS